MILSMNRNVFLSMALLKVLLFVCAEFCDVEAFASVQQQRIATNSRILQHPSQLHASSYNDSDAEVMPTSEKINAIKKKLMDVCGSSKDVDSVKAVVKELEMEAELVGIGQASSVSGGLNGEWELIYHNDDNTRSSPFFWCFRKAFPEQADQIFAITDGIPSPLKEIGEATQTIEVNNNNDGTLVSRVKVATMGGFASSIMTTRASITGVVGVDAVRLQIDTTKPEDSSVLQKLLGEQIAGSINSNTPAFPSGDALERAVPGSSSVVMRTSFCDDSIRVSRNEERSNDIFIWKRIAFQKSPML